MELSVLTRIILSVQIIDDLVKSKSGPQSTASKKKGRKRKQKESTTSTSTSESSKPLNLDILLKVTSAQQDEPEFAERVIERVYEWTLYFLKEKSADLSFPETVSIFYHEAGRGGERILRKFTLDLLIQCRKLVKSIPFTRGQTMMRQLLDKVEENANHIHRTRAGGQFTMKDSEKMVVG